MDYLYIIATFIYASALVVVPYSLAPDHIKNKIKKFIENIE